MHLFTNPIDDDAPTESIGNVIYYGPGYHRLYETDAKKLPAGIDSRALPDLSVRKIEFIW